MFVFTRCEKSGIIKFKRIGGEEMEKFWADIAIIGGGASGLAAAVSAAMTNSSLKIVIIERLDRVGKKILATGNGRCNLSNKNLGEEHYHGTIDAMKIIRKTSSAEHFFKMLGVICMTDDQGRMYPRSNSAATVLGAIRLKARELGITELCGMNVVSIKKSVKGYILATDTTEILSKRVIIAAGGYAAPSSGTDGSMMRILKEMGYQVSKICPAVAPLRVKPELLKGMKGVRAKGKIQAVSVGKILHEEFGEIQFTENSLSGICVFNFACLMSHYEGKLILRIDLLPEMSENELADYLFMVKEQRSNFEISELLTGIFAKNPAHYLIKRILNRPQTDIISTLKNGELRKLAKEIKSLEFEISGTSSWQNAQATSGGIHVSCVNENLESKLHKGIYFAGEILDVDGECGGYNLQWAWSSGIWSGKNCAESLKAGRNNGKN